MLKMIDKKKVDMEKGRQEKGCLFPHWKKVAFSTLENDRHGKRLTGKRLPFFTPEKGFLFPHWKMIDMEKC